MKAVNNGYLNTNAFEPTTSHEIFYSVNNAHQYSLNTIAFESTTSMPQSLYSGPFSTALATSADFLGPKKTLFDSAYLPLNELQNGQLMPTKFAQDMELPTKCSVCGHPTTCCHYDVPSCNGCKTFFRRSLVASKSFTCQFNEMCDIVNGIDQCRACRFDRCILTGMNPRLMRFPTSVDVANFSYKVSNRRRYLSQKYGERCPVFIGKIRPVFEETIEDKIIKSLIYVEVKVRKIRESSRWPSKSVIFQSIQELLESNHENVLAHANQYPKELKWPLTIDEARSEGRPNGHILDMFLCIEMARTMPVFSQLDYNDQEALLKQIILANTFLLQAFYSYQMESEIVVMPDGFSTIEVPKVYRSKRIIDTMKLISCRTMVPISRIQMTMEEFVLLKAIIYSHPAIHGLSNRARVLLEKESIRYSKTLMKHLQSRMGAAPGAKKYAEIISFTGALFHCAQQFRELYMHAIIVLRLPHCLPSYLETIMFT